MRICVTNDDGVGTTGITTLASRLWEAGHDVVVVAPADERSGAGTGLGRVVGGDSVSWRRDETDGTTTLAVDAPPAMCVLAALEGTVGPRPDVVVSGINHGPNLGLAVLHSGTVGAALTAHLAGVPALAVSVGEPSTGAHGAPRPADDPVWRAAADLALAVVDAVDGWAGRWVPNVNVPSTWADAGSRRPVRCARLAHVGAIGLATTSGDSAVVRLRGHADLGAEPVATGWPDDVSANAAGTATITPLSGIGLAPVAPAEVERVLGALTG